MKKFLRAFGKSKPETLTIGGVHHEIISMIIDKYGPELINILRSLHPEKYKSPVAVFPVAVHGSQTPRTRYDWMATTGERIIFICTGDSKALQLRYAAFNQEDRETLIAACEQLFKQKLTAIDRQNCVAELNLS